MGDTKMRTPLLRTGLLPLFPANSVCATPPDDALCRSDRFEDRPPVATEAHECQGIAHFFLVHSEERGYNAAPCNITNPGLPMLGGEPFRLLIRQVSAGNQDAAPVLVRASKLGLRRAICLRQTDPRARRVLDSRGICQSVPAKCFFRAALGQFEISSTMQPLKLSTMGTHHLLKRVGRLNAQRRDPRRQGG
jgi:hypothetical protein